MRAIVFAPRYLRSYRALGIARSEKARALGAVVGALAKAPTLPSPGDVVGMIPPTSEAFVRRVPKHNLWLWYVEQGADHAGGHAVLVLVALTAQPPP